MSTNFPFDRRIWRQAGDPLAAAARPGPLDGETLAVKDTIAIKGHRRGAGNPQWLDAAPVETSHAVVVEKLLNAGASITGIARCDEFAFALSGVNTHYGAVPNGAVPGRVSGGSSSGSASAVAHGQVSIGLGTDTAGSIRVPAAYQGLWSLRTTPGSVPMGGVMGLAPSFDTFGWFARDIDLLERVGDVLLPSDTFADDLELVTVNELLGVADDDVADAAEAVCAGVPRIELGLWVHDSWLKAFATMASYEAWRIYGGWLRFHLDDLGPYVRRRFERGEDLLQGAAVAASVEVTKAKIIIRDTLANRVLVIPSASSVAPLADDPGAAESVRRETVRLTCIASIAGLPVVNVPIRTAAGLPAGLSLVGPAGSDRALLRLAGVLA